MYLISIIICLLISYCAGNYIKKKNSKNKYINKIIKPQNAQYVISIIILKQWLETSRGARAQMCDNKRNRLWIRYPQKSNVMRGT